ncbi:DoxX family membrane protein [Dyadobacter sp. CY312]|uniref:DoxX family membrane protein n=1 Tax=Dyadobacter sp. CY312 TaxID=2907303 RepID=UPI001F38E3FD|nr:DoxX family membrane protein [Dyadobacter sp. CY312]MCE7040241.1 DoxX family membrane protein [Dyadobacter sp. CY312]
MKIAVIIIRSLLGFIFLASAVVVLFNLVQAPPLTGNVKIFNEGLMATGYFIPMLKVIELICGIALLSGFFVPLALVVLFPISVHIFAYHAVLAPEGLVISIVILAANLFLAWHYRKSYEPLFRAR